MESLNVNLGDRSYPIIIDRDILKLPKTFEQFVAQKSKILIVSNETISPLYVDRVKNALKPSNIPIDTFVLPDGERYKNLNYFGKLISFLLENHYGRDSILIALGGGVIGDLVGFVASCYMRGIDFIQVPTSLLAQVDSSVGGKTAVNHPLGKNMIGAFYQPKAVIIDTEVLRSLDNRHFYAGLAEIIKYGIIHQNDFFEWLEANINRILAYDASALQTAIQISCQIKSDIVREDEKEQSIRAYLNLGHTFGHAIEAELGYGNILHGEAVAIGILIACRISVNKNLLSENQYLQILNLIKKCNLPHLTPKQMKSASLFWKHMVLDKKVLNNKIRFIIPVKIGSVEIQNNINEEDIQIAIDYIISS
ncbi:3-dehydroquinate synthase [Paraphotobacterium marinum]|uniref:3-dehydroquinate synthase n=1 Tax=Paraphotobacterium marinum TaxID=1755811 RepID=A0A220VDJ2_9GAMM|nr:3-dehydroquinate synthase [Paraphotobacterium marinum]ASK78023.1 3-dehydroquinate synthase [Paraphotobacterium marinum]